MAVFGKKQRREKDEPRVPYQRDEQPTVPPPARPSHTTTPSSKLSVIGKTLFIKGNIFSDEEVYVEGNIEGKLHIKHRVVVGKSGVVNADIEAREVVIEGTVNGNVKGSYKVEIVPEGVLNGNIVSKGVVLREGAIFKGNIDMTVKNEKKPGKEKESPKAE